MRRLILILLTVLPGMVSAAKPDEKTYQVEIVVFQNVDVTSDEQSLTTPPPALPANAVEPDDMAPVGLQLGSALNAIGKNSHYRILSHHAWVQTLDSQEKVPPIHIHSDDGSLDGYVHFYMSRFLHFDVDLRYTDLADATHPVYRINVSRRIKSGETNYFDDPRFGVLVRLTALNNGNKK